MSFEFLYFLYLYGYIVERTYVFQTTKVLLESDVLSMDTSYICIFFENIVHSSLQRPTSGMIRI
jgi:hypothetical protein